MTSGRQYLDYAYCGDQKTRPHNVPNVFRLSYTKGGICVNRMPREVPRFWPFPWRWLDCKTLGLLGPYVSLIDHRLRHGPERIQSGL